MRPDIVAMAPDRIKRLPVDQRGFPVPYFVTWIDGKPEFRVVEDTKRSACFKRKLCWVCGEPLGRYLAFAIGPMCVVNRTTTEGAQHLECAQFAAKACPFLTNPQARRREGSLPDQKTAPPGIFLTRNPGAVAVYVTRFYKPFQVPNGVLFQLGEPTAVHWYALGKEATREQIEASLNTGLPALMEIAEDEGQEAVNALNNYVAEARSWFPT